MKETLLKVWNYIIPSTAVGFLYYGWLGSLACSLVVPILHPIAVFVITLLVFGPLYLRAKAVQAFELETAKFLNELARQVVEVEESREDA